MADETPLVADSTEAAPTDRPEALADAIGTGDQLEAEIQNSIAPASPQPANQAVASPMALQELDGTGAGGAPSLGELELLSDVNVEVTVEFGRTSLPLRRLLQLRRGSLLELSRRPEDKVTILANGTPIAYGDVVVVGDQVGVHIVELVEPAAPKAGEATGFPVAADAAPAPAEPAAAAPEPDPAPAAAAAAGAAPEGGGA